MYKNLMLSQTFSNFFEPSQTVLSLFLQNITKFFLHFNSVENLDLAVRGMLCMPYSKVKYNIQNLDLAVGGMLCIPHSKVKYKIQFKISTPTEHYQTLPNFP